MTDKLQRRPDAGSPNQAMAPLIPGYFVCVGAQKGGTRWLYDQIQLHPDFWMPPVKESKSLHEENGPQHCRQ